MNLMLLVLALSVLVGVFSPRLGRRAHLTLALLAVGMIALYLWKPSWM